MPRRSRSAATSSSSAPVRSARWRCAGRGPRGCRPSRSRTWRSRLALAAAGGATHCSEGPLTETRAALLAAAGRDGYDVVVDTTGNPAVFADALGLVAPFGRLVLLGDTGYPSRQTLTSDVMTRGLTIVATHDHHDRGGWTQRRIDALFFQHARSGAFPLAGLVTHEFRPEDCERAYALATEHRDRAVGILFDWTGE